LEVEGPVGTTIQKLADAKRKAGVVEGKCEQSTNLYHTVNPPRWVGYRLSVGRGPRGGGYLVGPRLVGSQSVDVGLHLACGDIMTNDIKVGVSVDTP
jgi:hypothetical protein